MRDCFSHPVCRVDSTAAGFHTAGPRKMIVFISFVIVWPWRAKNTEAWVVCF